ncbi:GGDEF domain-containing protein [Pseudohalioglobus sediminis]|uniref:diguanylate cyclase n=1 Tax=Pseudohalioglobus sediminis TaxID=2606449 RepID=A0A5B0WQG6_9GAMM|nr:GGDEF domain-containing protein [Pseudohalioglobus sediminis]KAA1188827.1 GGDEF domain-containing protein [Pseudohalioglobus sediminis]
MIYQRRIPREELFSSQLELLMQNGQLATVTAHLIGVAATIAMFWPFLDITVILLWAAAFLILLLLRSLQMSNALVSRSYLTNARGVYLRLIAGAAATGAIWAGVYIFAAHHVPITMQYTFLLLILMITAISVGFSVIIREYFIAYLFAAIWPIAWWSLAHYWEQPYNLLIGLGLLAFCAVLVVVCDRLYRSFRNMIVLNWERETMSQELADITNSLRDRNRQLRDARRQLTDLANIDELTGLGNRRVVNRALKEEINRARRSGGFVSLILLDVDFFKNYNDTYGHPAGDLVLQKLADLMQQASSRAGEVVARYGGEEFVLILPGAEPDSALRTANRLKDMVEDEKIPHESSGAADVITVSQGLVTVQPEGELLPAELISRADQALYKAKKAGRNRIAVAGRYEPSLNL